jgi:hypothetical protein
MYHYDPQLALAELSEDAVLPHPVHVRDMMLRSGLAPDEAVELNHLFQDYLRSFAETQRIARTVLEHLAKRHPGHAAST